MGWIASGVKALALKLSISAAAVLHAAPSVLTHRIRNGYRWESLSVEASPQCTYDAFPAASSRCRVHPGAICPTRREGR